MSEAIICKKRQYINPMANYVYITEIITANTLWEVPRTIYNNELHVLAFGGGGGGGISSGGGGGYMNSATLQLESMSQVQINIGDGGNAQSVVYFGGKGNFTSGKAGGTTTFGNYLSANGGSAGNNHNGGSGGSGGGGIWVGGTGYQFGGGGGGIIGGNGGTYGGGGGCGDTNSYYYHRVISQNTNKFLSDYGTYCWEHNEYFSVYNFLVNLSFSAGISNLYGNGGNGYENGTNGLNTKNIIEEVNLNGSGLKGYRTTGNASGYDHSNNIYIPENNTCYNFTEGNYYTISYNAGGGGGGYGGRGGNGGSTNIANYRYIIGGGGGGYGGHGSSGYHGGGGGGYTNNFINGFGGGGYGSYGSGGNVNSKGNAGIVIISYYGQT